MKNSSILEPKIDRNFARFLQHAPLKLQVA